MIQKPRYTFLPIGSVKPQGWLRRQLEIQAAGLGGKLHTFWPDIKESRWIGGSQEGWERVPYWLDGFIPLAYLLENDDLIEVAKYYIEYIIDTQMEDGWIGPYGEAEERKTCDLWSHILIAKVLTVYADASGDERIPDVLRRLFAAMDTTIKRKPLFEWAQMRWYEALIPILWLYERSKDEWLIDFATTIRSQGFDWRGFFERWPQKMKNPTPKGDWNHMGHVVNNAMAIKSSALWGLFSGERSDMEFPEKMIEMLDAYHGQVTGVFTGDECLAGRSPIQGTELCAVVEYMYSLEWLSSITADPTYGDRLEKITFNALPATFLPDMWAHQYDQQVNQVQCSLETTAPFKTNSPESHLYGLEPNFGCCTANMHQGWPKFITDLIMGHEKGFAITAYGPAKLETTCAGEPFIMRIETDYPFKDTISVSIEEANAISATLAFRIPGWCSHPEVLVNGVQEASVPGTYLDVNRVWKAGDTVHLHFPSEPMLVDRPEGLVAVTKDPLVFALPISEVRREASSVLRRTSDHKADTNWELLPDSPWNYGVVTDGMRGIHPEMISEAELPAYPFSPETPPVRMRLLGKIVNWDMEGGCCARTPKLPGTLPPEPIELIPYGCTNLRVTEMISIPADDER